MFRHNLKAISSLKRIINREQYVCICIAILD